jgi:hypothetical protein
LFVWTSAFFAYNKDDDDVTAVTAANGNDGGIKIGAFGRRTDRTSTVISSVSAVIGVHTMSVYSKGK